jgi:hypothetical protein
MDRITKGLIHSDGQLILNDLYTFTPPVRATAFNSKAENLGFELPFSAAYLRKREDAEGEGTYVFIGKSTGFSSKQFQFLATLNKDGKGSKAVRPPNSATRVFENVNSF